MIVTKSGSVILDGSDAFRILKEKRALEQVRNFGLDYTSDEWKTIRNEVFAESGRVCYYCDAPATQVDHRLPARIFPELRFDKSNLVPCCKACNEAKGNEYTRLSRERQAEVAKALSEGRGNIEPGFHRGAVPLTRAEVAKLRKRGFAKNTVLEQRKKELLKPDRLFDKNRKD